jgi:CheY-like chemotaxis protein
MTFPQNPLVLLVDPAEADRTAIRKELSRQYRVVEAPNTKSATSVLMSSERIDLLLTSREFPDGTGLQVLDEALGFWPPIPVIFMIEEGHERAAMVALRKGAADYVVKGITESLRLTRILANALARSQVELTAQQRSREMGVLNAVLTALNRQMDEEPVLDTSVHELHALMGTDACSIILADPDADQMVLRASTRLPIRNMVWPVPPSKSIAGRVVRERKGCITEDVTQDPDWYSLDADDLVPTPVRSMLTVPLLSGTQAIGVLQLINKRVGPFLASDLSLMESVAAVATAAIMRGQRFAQLRDWRQKQTEQSAAVERVARTILEQTDAIETGLPPLVTRPQLEAIREQARQLLELTAS